MSARDLHLSANVLGGPEPRRGGLEADLFISAADRFPSAADRFTSAPDLFQSAANLFASA